MKQLTIAIIIFINFQIKAQGQETCGRRLVNQETLIINGFESKEGDWPWHTAIYHVDINLSINYKCGGTLITSNSVLTAAHCVFDNNRPILPERVSVQLGKFNLIVFGTHSQEFQAFKVIPHQSYSTTDFSNDIAVIRLSTEASLNNYVQPICLWDSSKTEVSEVIGKLGTVVGWGITETNKISFILRQTNMPVVSLTTCLASNRDFFGPFLSDKTLCGGFRNGTSACRGDSGGAIVFEENGVYRIRGIVSLTESTKDSTAQERKCNTKSYVIFTDVAKYLPWIEAVVPELKSSSAGSALPETNSKQSANSGGLPADIVEHGLGRSDSIFECSKYDGFAGCWHRDWQRRDRNCPADCSRGVKWEYPHITYGTCYCCKCN